jgi:uroporphyrinogen-III synthase
MARILEAKIEVIRLPLSKFAVSILHHLDRYDIIAFTSKHAHRFFYEALREHNIPKPRVRVLRVGPREDLLRHDIDTKKILFPRSALAPSDILKKLRQHGATVRTIRLYTARGATLSPSAKRAFYQNTIDALRFKSPSGIYGILGQLRGVARKNALKLPALCIGSTTLAAARRAGFKRVSITNSL